MWTGPVRALPRRLPQIRFRNIISSPASSAQPAAIAILIPRGNPARSVLPQAPRIFSASFQRRQELGSRHIGGEDGGQFARRSHFIYASFDHLVSAQQYPRYRFGLPSPPQPRCQRAQSFAAEPVSLDSPLPSPARGFGSLPHRALQILGLVEVFRRIEADRRDQLGRVEIGAGEIRIGERDPSEVRTRK